LGGNYLSAKIKNRKGEEGEKVLKVGLKSGKITQKDSRLHAGFLSFFAFCAFAVNFPALYIAAVDPLSGKRIAAFFRGFCLLFQANGVSDTGPSFLS
jgi:hypothetical protein